MNDLLYDVKELVELSRILREDELECMTNALKGNNQFWRRMYVRSFFAHVEGVAFRLKQQSLSASERFGIIKLSPDEISIINEESYELTDNAQIKRKPIYSPIDRTIRFAFDIVLKVHGKQLDLNLGNDNRWNCFKESIKIRNRIMHPKNSNDLTISDKELNNILEAVKWFSDTLSLLTKSLLEADVVVTKK